MALNLRKTTAQKGEERKVAGKDSSHPCLLAPALYSPLLGRLIRTHVVRSKL